MGSTIQWNSLCLVAGDAFLAVDGVIGEALEEHAGDQFLGADVEFELDVVRCECIDVERRAEVAAQEFAGGAGGARPRFRDRWRWAWTKWSRAILHKTKREEK